MPVVAPLSAFVSGVFPVGFEPSFNGPVYYSISHIRHSILLRDKKVGEQDGVRKQ